MKTAVSIPDDLFEQAEKLAAERNMSRSALYAEALRTMLGRVNDAAITAQLNEAFATVDPPKADKSQLARLRRELDRDGGQW